MMKGFLKRFMTSTTEGDEENRRLNKNKTLKKQLKHLKSFNEDDWAKESDEVLKKITGHESELDGEHFKLKEDQDKEKSKSKNDLEGLASPEAPLEEIKYKKYKVKNDDTLEGITLRFNVSVRQIKELNGFSSDTIYPGQTLKIKPIDKTKSDKENDADNGRISVEVRSISPPAKSAARKRSSFDLGEAYSKSIRSFFVNYCTSSGEVRGTMIISSMCIVFQPSPQFIKKNADKIQREYFLRKFTIRIDLADVADCNIITVPSQDFIANIETAPEFSKDFLLQLSLIGLGRRVNDQVLDEELVKLREKNIPFAVVSFRIPTNNKENEKIKNEEKSKLASEIEKTIKNLINDNKYLQQDRMFYSKSKIPMVDIMYEKIPVDLRNKLRHHYKMSTTRSLSTVEVQVQENEAHLEEEEKTDTTTDLLDFSRKEADYAEKDFEFLPKIKDQSTILPYESFIKLFKKVPSMFRVFDWKLLYSISVHGISLQHLYRRAEGNAPCFLIMKDDKDNAFGAFTTEYIRQGPHYYGNGETFLFTFKNNAVDPKFYHWTEKNNYFCFANSDGIIFGSGNHYGLFINNNLISGRTYKCDTFDNEPLVDEIEFTIMKLELWTIEDVEF